ncbi:helix-turn-helix transcriptional regulator [Ruminococcus flavefaciens]|uniref:helix-turn-helix transcriptional regulator n=1 Tax=Ruminococcus flavefaciens TaxID=1265 RepID=UPI0004B8FCFB|nr:AraC family transcriptional regulator [Ruminococcus flavefaciens]
MKTDRDLNYRLYIQRNDGFMRSPFERELSVYRMVQSGDIEGIKKRFEIIRRNFFEGKGTLSNDPVRNVMYHFVTAVALVARFCIEGGMELNTAYTLSDIYIQRADKLSDAEKIIDLLGEMQLDFTERMRTLKKENVISIHVRKCIDYIYEHLHEELTLTRLADHVGLNPSYLSKLFSKEKGMSIKSFIIQAKVATAENLLRYSDFSCLEISLALGFSSQSAFISVFKKIDGITPKKFRELHYLDVMEQNK